MAWTVHEVFFGAVAAQEGALGSDVEKTSQTCEKGCEVSL